MSLGESYRVDFGDYPLCTCPPDNFENDDSQAEAKPILVGLSGLQERTFCDDATDWVSFMATSGRVYTITTSAYGQRADTFLALYDTDGETILDACAAPGGKATYIAQITQNRAHVQANDRTPHKIELVKESACRLGIDSLYYSMSDASIVKFPTVDKALVDAPCTGTGILARRADLRWNRRPEELIRARAIQAGILNNVAAAVRDQGFLVYSTCSLEYEENWTTVTEFIDCHPEFSVEPADKYVDSCYCDEKGAVRILPFIHNLTGSFAVRLKKIS